jgi:hypothetical protein
MLCGAWDGVALSLFGSVRHADEDEDTLDVEESTADLDIYTSTSYEWVVAMMTYFIGMHPRTSYLPSFLHQLVSIDDSTYYLFTTPLYVCMQERCGLCCRWTRAVEATP